MQHDPGEAVILFGADWAPIRHFGDVISADPKRVYGDLIGRFQEADYRIFNLEAPLFEGRLITKSGAAFCGKPEAVAALEAVHCSAAGLANNHVFDCGTEGFRATRQLLTQHGIASFGAGNDLAEARKPLELELNGLRIAVYPVSEGEDMMGATESTPGVRGWEPEVLAGELRANRARYDFQVVFAHCGLEYQPYPSCYVYETFRLWAEAGANLIAGHHPHVLQGKTVFGKTPAFFSLGNFIFYQDTRLLNRKLGALLQVRFSRQRGVETELIPYRIADDGVRKLTPQEREHFDRLFADLSKPLGDDNGAKAAWHAVLAHYGCAGFADELERILKTMREDPGKGAAMLRNRVSCIQHRSQWLDGLTRIVDGSISCADPELVAMVERYLTETF